MGSNEIKKCLPSISKQVFNETSATISGSCADGVKEENKAMLKETNTTQNALKETLKRVDVNVTEQRKRTGSVIITGVDERDDENVQTEVTSVLQRIEENFISSQIVNCERLGP